MALGRWTETSLSWAARISLIVSAWPAGSPSGRAHAHAAAPKHGLGLAYMPEDQALEYIAESRLIRILEDWCEPFPGYHLYYPSRRHSSPAFALLVEALRHRGA